MSKSWPQNHKIVYVDNRAKRPADSWRPVSDTKRSEVRRQKSVGDAVCKVEEMTADVDQVLADETAAEAVTHNRR